MLTVLTFFYCVKLLKAGDRYLFSFHSDSSDSIAVALVTSVVISLSTTKRSAASHDVPWDLHIDRDAVLLISRRAAAEAAIFALLEKQTRF